MFAYPMIYNGWYHLMKKLPGFLIAGLLILTGLGLVYVGVRRPITILVDGEPRQVWTRALTVAQALQEANIAVRQTDQLAPAPNHWLGWAATISLAPSRQVNLWDGGNGDQPASPALQRAFWSVQRLPGNLLSQAGVRLYPGDRIFWQGLGVLPGQPLPAASVYDLQYQPASPVNLIIDGSQVIFGSSAATLGQALWENGQQFSEVDSLSRFLEAPLPLVEPVSLQRALPLTITVGGKKSSIYSAAATVGQALAQAGIALQGLDYSKPAEDQPLPPNGKIRVVRVQEQVTLEQTQLPYKTEYVADPDTELDQSSLVYAGQVGIQVTRLRVRYEDGQETEKTTEAQWTASQPRNRKVGYGTKVVIRSLDTPAGKIQYWRAITVYATAYSPCGLGNVAKCYYGTSSGLPVKRGVIAVTYKWYSVMGGQAVYVPGYGNAVIADVGGGIPGKNWIDLGFTDAELEEWHQNVILYFLTPVPADIPWILP
jgi:resuscitation-promoting factor RpfB